VRLLRLRLSFGTEHVFDLGQPQQVAGFRGVDEERSFQDVPGVVRQVVQVQCRDAVPGALLQFLDQHDLAPQAQSRERSRHAAQAAADHGDLRPPRHAQLALMPMRRIASP
jgi:hypothetical protein